MHTVHQLEDTKDAETCAMHTDLDEGEVDHESLLHYYKTRHPVCNVVTHDIANGVNISCCWNNCSLALPEDQLRFKPYDIPTYDS